MSAPALSLLPLPSLSSAAGFPPGLAASSFLAFSSGFSSSLSGAMGEGRSFLRTIAYTLRLTGRLILAMLPGDATGPRSVLAAKKRYLPLRSQAGDRASLMPSVTCVALPAAME